MRRYTLLAGIMASAFMFGTSRAQDGGDAPPWQAVIDVDVPTAPEARSPESQATFDAWLGLSFDARTTPPAESGHDPRADSPPYPLSSSSPGRSQV